MIQWAAGIRRLRQSNGWKQATLAEMMGVDQATVSRWERGLQTPEVSMRKRLAELMRSRVPELDRLQMLSIQASPNIAMAFDQDLRVLAVSESAAALYGMPPAAFVGQTLNDRLSADFVWALERAEESGLWRGAVAAMRFVARFVGIDDVEHCLQVAWTPVFVTGGDVVICAQMCEVDRAEFTPASRDRLVIVAMDDVAVA